jgi:hypothetical protein
LIGATIEEIVDLNGNSWCPKEKKQVFVTPKMLMIHFINNQGTWTKDSEYFKHAIFLPRDQNFHLQWKLVFDIDKIEWI